MGKFLAWISAHSANVGTAYAILDQFPNNKYLVLINVIIAALLKTPQRANLESKIP
jgi:hypothetical protein